MRKNYQLDRKGSFLSITKHEALFVFIYHFGFSDDELGDTGFGQQVSCVLEH